MLEFKFAFLFFISCLYHFVSLSFIFHALSGFLYNELHISVFSTIYASFSYLVMQLIGRYRW